ncbi:hypothetical protein [Bacteroides fluxus]|jgi:hypothetical protein|uniref:hypothetical protein n=2 Tax=Bacteroides fluxus TaxID=626930 RepID=UPI0023A7C273|nr:hypothetical protein [Bacteroides fluxus]
MNEMRIIRQTFAILKQNPLLSTISILGTAFAITMIMVVEHGTLSGWLAGGLAADSADGSGWNMVSGTAGYED